MAALTMSFDQNACRYAAAVQTNGHRVEMITPNNIRGMMLPLFEQWISNVGGGRGPQHIYYFRDGVSEGQFTHVLNNELTDMKTALSEKYGQQIANSVSVDPFSIINLLIPKQIKWTVIVCTKRHHIRFFPKEGDSQSSDRNANALPGTLVESDVTHPFEYDFYLNAHAAIQGTARPVHYHVLLDEAKVPVNDLQKMIYQFSYQYMRSTTPVSLCEYFDSSAREEANISQSLPFTMHTWLLTVLALTSLLPLPRVLVVVRSSRRPVRMLLSVPQFMVLKAVLRRLALPCRLRLLRSFLWATLTKVLDSSTRSATVCGTSKVLISPSRVVCTCFFSIFKFRFYGGLFYLAVSDPWIPGCANYSCT